MAASPLQQERLLVMVGQPRQLCPDGGVVGVATFCATQLACVHAIGLAVASGDAAAQPLTTVLLGCLY